MFIVPLKMQLSMKPYYVCVKSISLKKSGDVCFHFNLKGGRNCEHPAALEKKYLNPQIVHLGSVHDSWLLGLEDKREDYRMKIVSFWLSLIETINASANNYELSRSMKDELLEWAVGETVWAVERTAAKKGWSASIAKIFAEQYDEAVKFNGRVRQYASTP